MLITAAHEWLAGHARGTSPPPDTTVVDGDASAEHLNHNAAGTFRPWAVR
jgi:hypothetical protein